MTPEETQALFLTLANEYMLCKRVSLSEAVSAVNSAVIDELQKHCNSRLAAAVCAAEARRAVLHKEVKKRKRR